MAPRPANSGEHEALGLALALHRSPGLRFDLRARPLPRSIDLVLRITAGNQAALEDSAAQLDEPPATLLDAARFYVQQVLLEPGTSAYRILGVAPDAEFAQIREHHHWLQRWLHPDRSGDTDDTYAARINWAWQQLRTIEARAAYDAAHPTDPAARCASPPAPSVAMHWTAIPVARHRHVWRYAAIGTVACAGCAWLLYAMVMGGAAPPGVVPAQSESVPAIPVASPPDRQPQARPPATVVEGLPRRITPPVRGIRVSPSSRTPATTPADKSTSPRQAPRGPSSERVPAHTAPAARLPNVPKLRAGVVNHAPRAITAAPPAPHIRVAAVQPPAPAQATNITPQVSNTAPVITPSPIVAGTALPTSVSPAALLQRVELARERLRAVVDYIQRAGNAAPDWTEAAPPYNASRQRAALRTRHRLGPDAALTLAAPDWRITDNHASVNATYFLHGHRRFIEQGRLQLQMMWARDSWRITHIQLEPSP